MYTFNHKLITAVAAVGSLFFTGCITDDGIPYPDVHANFSSFEVDGQIGTAQIDSIKNIVTVDIADTVDVYAVRVLKYTLTPGDLAQLVDPGVFDRPINLSDTFNLQLKAYRDYSWRIAAVQQIDRYFNVENQIGASVIDAVNHTVEITLPTSQPLESVKVTSAKLAGGKSVSVPRLEGETINLSRPLEVAVTDFGRTVIWTITARQTDSTLALAGVDAWSGVAWLYVNALKIEGVKIYCRGVGSNPTDAVQIQPARVDNLDGTYRVLVNNLTSETEYELFAESGETVTDPLRFTTGVSMQLPNSLFREWCIVRVDDKYDVLSPWSEGGTPFWSTSNRGTATLKKTNVYGMDNSTSPTGKQGAQLDSRYVGVAGLGKFGAGSIFAGIFYDVDGTNGILHMGRPFGVRPVGVRVNLKYKPDIINNADAAHAYLKGRTDTCIVWFALSNRTEPYEIRTNIKNPQYFNPDDPSIIAYGEYCSGDDTGNITVDVMLDYRQYDVVPQQILLTASSSKYGDFFTGAGTKDTGSALSVYSYELLYSY